MACDIIIQWMSTCTDVFTAPPNGIRRSFTSGKCSIFPVSKHLIKWLLAFCKSHTHLDGLYPKAISVAFAIANKPQSNKLGYAIVFMTSNLNTLDEGLMKEHICCFISKAIFLGSALSYNNAPPCHQITC